MKKASTAKLVFRGKSYMSISEAATDYGVAPTQVFNAMKKLRRNGITAREESKKEKYKIAEETLESIVSRRENQDSNRNYASGLKKACYFLGREYESQKAAAEANGIRYVSVTSMVEHKRISFEKALLILYERKVVLQQMSEREKELKASSVARKYNMYRVKDGEAIESIRKNYGKLISFLKAEKYTVEYFHHRIEGHGCDIALKVTHVDIVGQCWLVMNGSHSYIWFTDFAPLVEGGNQKTCMCGHICKYNALNNDAFIIISKSDEKGMWELGAVMPRVPLEVTLRAKESITIMKECQRFITGFLNYLKQK